MGRLPHGRLSRQGGDVSDEYESGWHDGAFAEAHARMEGLGAPQRQALSLLTSMLRIERHRTPSEEMAVAIWILNRSWRERCGLALRVLFGHGPSRRRRRDPLD